MEDSSYGIIERELNIDQETFDQIISNESAKQQICEALLHCLENVSDLGDIALWSAPVNC